MKQEVLSAYESEKFISKHVAVPESQLVRKFSEISIKTPLVLKIISQQAIHKSDLGLIKIIHNKNEIEPSFNELITTARKNKLKIDGILVQKFVEGQQFIICLKKDNIFGHVILFGLGGIFTELLDDISIRKCPITQADAQEMLNELKSAKLFHGFRNIKLNTQLLKETLVAVSKIPQKHREIKELDINPLILNAKEGKAVDARIVLEKY
ncbi:MAG: acetate--CoA ligase family protein [Nanoarchaeota archaeon]